MGIHFELESDSLRMLEAIYEANLDSKWHLDADWKLTKVPAAGPYGILNIVTGIDLHLGFPNLGAGTLMEMARCGEWVIQNQEVCPTEYLPHVADFCVLIGFDRRKRRLDEAIKEYGWDAVKTGVEMFVRWCHIGLEFDAEVVVF